jgi:hypothetical protein
MVHTHNQRSTIFPCWLQFAVFSGKRANKAAEGVIF